MHLYLVYSKFSVGLAISNNIIVSDSMSKVHDICPRTSWILLGSLDIKVLSHYPLKCHASCHDFLLKNMGATFLGIVQWEIENFFSPTVIGPGSKAHTGTL